MSGSSRKEDRQDICTLVKESQRKASHTMKKLFISTLFLRKAVNKMVLHDAESSKVEDAWAYLHTRTFSVFLFKEKLQ